MHNAGLAGWGFKAGGRPWTFQMFVLSYRPVGIFVDSLRHTVMLRRGKQKGKERKHSIMPTYSIGSFMELSGVLTALLL